jgi:4-hydroxybenzoate polyprenyltransferase
MPAMGAMDYLRLLRPYQWYKNAVIFIAVFFTGQFFIWDKIILTTIGFIALCLMSSTNYILNDIIDRKEDRKHPEKRKRPIASGQVSVFTAVGLAALTFTSSLLISYYLSLYFLLAVIALFALTTAYSLLLRSEPFLDIIAIGANFVLRSISGAFIILSDVSPWLVICAFFLALYMGFGKRRSDIVMIGSKAKEHRKVFACYTPELLDQFSASLMAALLVSYSLYTFLKADTGLMITLPIVTYALYRYQYLIHCGSSFARHPEQLVKDWRLVIAGIVWLVILFGSIYVTP